MFRLPAPVPGKQIAWPYEWFRSSDRAVWDSARRVMGVDLGRRLRTRWFDSCQVQLGTRSAIFAVGRHFVQGAPFAIPTAPGADLSDRLRARVPSEVATETLQCRCSYGQAVQSGIKLPLRNFEPVSAHQTVVRRFNRFFEREPGFQHRRDILWE